MMRFPNTAKQYRYCPLLSFVVLCCLIFSTCAKEPPARSELVLGTKCTVNLFEYGNQKLYERIFERLREIEKTMIAAHHGKNSGWEGVLHTQLSGIMLINQNAGIAPVQVGADLLEVLERACYYAELSNGAFDPTVGPLVSAWGIGTESEQIPGQQEIDRALALINWQDLIIDHEQGTAFLQQPGMEIDLGAIAKGYAADEAARIAGEGGAARAIIDLGGNIVALGSRSSNAPWRIGIQDPLEKRNAYIGIISVNDKTVVTSGIYERYFEQDGKQYHHILSTKDGYPVDNGLISVSIVTERSIDADGLSTAVFALGFQQGLELLKAIPRTDAIFIFADRSVYVTDGIREVFRLTNDDYFIPTSSISNIR